MQTRYSKRSLPSFFFFLTLLLPFSQINATNDTNKKTSAIFWEIRNPKTGALSYLYGSIHIQDKKVFAFDSTVLNKMKTCQTFALEMELDKISPSSMMKYMNMKDSYDALLSAEDLQIFKNVCENSIGINYKTISKMHPFFVSMMIMMPYFPKDMEDPLDAYFLKLARKNKMNVIGIESLEEQMQTVNSMPMPLQIEMLISAIRDMSKEKMQAEVDKLMEPYLREDSEALWTLSSDTTQIESNTTFVENFLLKRNVNMANVIDEAMQKSTVFTVIGAAHLGGPQGIVALLQQKGYTVLPLKAGLLKN